MIKLNLNTAKRVGKKIASVAQSKKQMAAIGAVVVGLGGAGAGAMTGGAANSSGIVPMEKIPGGAGAVTKVVSDQNNDFWAGTAGGAVAGGEIGAVGGILGGIGIASGIGRIARLKRRFE